MAARVLFNMRFCDISMRFSKGDGGKKGLER